MVCHVSMKFFRVIGDQKLENCGKLWKSGKLLNHQYMLVFIWLYFETRTTRITDGELQCHSKKTRTMLSFSNELMKLTNFFLKQKCIIQLIDFRYLTLSILFQQNDHEAKLFLTDHDAGCTKGLWLRKKEEGTCTLSITLEIPTKC